MKKQEFDEYPLIVHRLFLEGIGWAIHPDIFRSAQYRVIVDAINAQLGTPVGRPFATPIPGGVVIGIRYSDLQCQDPKGVNRNPYITVGAMVPGNPPAEFTKRVQHAIGSHEAPTSPNDIQKLTLRVLRSQITEARTEFNRETLKPTTGGIPDYSDGWLRNVARSISEFIRLLWKPPSLSSPVLDKSVERLLKPHGVQARADDGRAMWVIIKGLAAITFAQQVVIGKSLEASDIVFLGNGVALRHAIFVRSTKQWAVMPLWAKDRSLFAVRHKGTLITTSAFLQDGDRLSFGDPVHEFIWRQPKTDANTLTATLEPIKPDAKFHVDEGEVGRIVFCDDTVTLGGDRRFSHIPLDWSSSTPLHLTRTSNGELMLIGCAILLADETYDVSDRHRITGITKLIIESDDAGDSPNHSFKSPQLQLEFSYR